jgi:hypothetical protein
MTLSWMCELHPNMIDMDGMNVLDYTQVASLQVLSAVYELLPAWLVAICIKNSELHPTVS